jgi:hypothetical protein
MKKSRCLTVLVVLFWFAIAALAVDDPDTKLIEAHILTQARTEHGEEYKEARQVVTGDLNHDGIPDLALLYTIEGQDGTNRSIQYLAVFVRRSGKLAAAARVEVGGKGNRFVELKSIEGNIIHLETLDYGPKDAACCPSEKGETNYVLADNTLRERKRVPVRRK